MCWGFLITVIDFKGNSMKFIILIAILAIVFGPFLTIWSLNVLFPVLAIPYSIETWAASVILGSFLVRAGVK